MRVLIVRAVCGTSDGMVLDKRPLVRSSVNNGVKRKQTSVRGKHGRAVFLLQSRVDIELAARYIRRIISK